MALNWDLFCDETKLEGDVDAVGILALEVGVVSNLTAILIADRDRILNLRKVNNREVHWVDIDTIEAEIARAWIASYFRTPMAFFIYVPASVAAGNRLTFVQRAVERLEADPRVPGGLTRGQTTIHLDYDSVDVRQLWQLRRNFGLLRAFPWDSHGSPLLQLSDVLLGICHSLYTGNPPANSVRGRNKQTVIAAARQAAAAARRNLVFAYERRGIRQLLL